MVEKLVISVLLLADKVDACFWGFCVEVDFKAFECVEVDETAVSMVWGKVKVREEISPDYGLLDVCDDEFKPEYLFA